MILLYFPLNAGKNNFNDRLPQDHKQIDKNFK